MTNSFDIGHLSFDIPADCPQPSVYEGVVRDAYRECFGSDSKRASFCASEYQRDPNGRTPGTTAWNYLNDAVQDAFHPEIEGGPAIQGWRPGNVSVRANEAAQQPIRTKSQEPGFVPEIFRPKGRGRER